MRPWIRRRKDRLRRSGRARIREGAPRVRSSRARNARARLGGRVDRRPDEEAHGQRERSAMDADDGERDEARAPEHSRAVQSRGTQRVLYVTHWDTRPKADDDPNFGNKARPILGANDGASGVGLFLALGDVFKKTPPSVGVDLLFVDGEDWGAFDSDSAGALSRRAVRVAVFREPPAVAGLQAALRRAVRHDRRRRPADLPGSELGPARTRSREARLADGRRSGLSKYFIAKSGQRSPTTTCRCSTKGCA